jgi:hypothetical protein
MYTHYNIYYSSDRSIDRCFCHSRPYRGGSLILVALAMYSTSTQQQQQQQQQQQDAIRASYDVGRQYDTRIVNAGSRYVPVYYLDRTPVISDNEALELATASHVPPYGTWSPVQQQERPTDSVAFSFHLSGGR